MRAQRRLLFARPADDEVCARHLRGDFEEKREVLLMRQPPHSTDDERPRWQRPFFPRPRAQLRAGAIRFYVNPVVNRRHAVGGDALVLHEELARALGDGDDVRGERIRERIRRQRPRARVGELVVAVVVIDAHAHSAHRRHRLGDHIRREQMRVDDIVAPREKTPREPWHVERHFMMKRQRAHRHAERREPLPHLPPPVHRRDLKLKARRVAVPDEILQHHLRSAEVERVDYVEHAIAV